MIYSFNEEYLDFFGMKDENFSNEEISIGNKVIKFIENNFYEIAKKDLEAKFDSIHQLSNWLLEVKDNKITISIFGPWIFSKKTFSIDDLELSKEEKSKIIKVGRLHGGFWCFIEK